NGSAAKNGTNAHLEAAIKYHDMAVSLLVGVFDDEEEVQDEGDDNAAAVVGYGVQHSDSTNSKTSESREPTTQQQRQEPPIRERGESDVWITGTFSDQEEEDEESNISQEEGNSQKEDEGENDKNDHGGGNAGGGRVMLTIRVPNDAKLNRHYLNIPPPATSATKTIPTAITQATFLQPTEDERVRSIAVSLNALAELHAQCGDDRAAMDSYREALEILRAATEEEEVEEEDGDENVNVSGDIEVAVEKDNGESGSSRGMDAPGAIMSPSRQQQQPPQQNLVNKQSSSLSASEASKISHVQSDLANTLMNVGNFHLRRDELDAALNAYSTVWTLHNGNSLNNEQEDNVTNGEGNNSPYLPIPLTPSNNSVVGASPPSVSLLPHLTTPQTPASAQKSLCTPNNSSAVQSPPSFATPNNNVNNNDTPTSSASPGALAALSNLGIVHERRNELHEALSCFRYVHTARVGQLGRDHLDTLNSLVNIGNCYQRLGEWDEGDKVYDEAVRGYRKLIQCGLDSKDMVDDKVRSILHRSLAGALRNHGTCYMKQHRVLEAITVLNEAVDVEEQIVTMMLSRGNSGGALAQESVRQAKESAAQLLGLLGCLYLEDSNKQQQLQQFHVNSEKAFQRAIQLYTELGYDLSHPSIVWAKHNLAVVVQQREQQQRQSRVGVRGVPPPPPPPTTPSPRSIQSATPPKPTPVGASPASAAATSDNNDSDVVDLDDINSIELSEVLATDDDGNNYHEDDDIFSGVDQSSTDELDEFLSREAVEEAGASFPGRGKESATRAAPDEGRHNSFEEEVNFDEDTQSNPEHIVDRDTASAGKPLNKPLSNEHRNISSSLLSDQGEHAESQNDHSHDAEEDERVSQLQLQTAGSEDGDTLEAARAHVALAEHFWEKDDRASATEHYFEAHSIYVTQIGDTSNKEVAMVLKRLGDLNAEDGALDDAKELYVEALEMELMVHGTHLPQTLNAAGAACLKNDDFRSAMEFHRKALQIQKTSTGQNKYEKYETLVRIGNVYYSERNSVNGVDYSEFIESGFLGWIANAHDMRGEYIKAIQFYDESLQISMSRVGKQKEAKRETALTLNRLGALTRELGRYDEAMDYHQQALNIQKSGSGVAKAMTAETCVLMGMVKSKMGEFKSALDVRSHFIFVLLDLCTLLFLNINVANQLFEDSFLVLKKALGENHPSSRKTMVQIGSVHFELSNYDKAMAILLEAKRWLIASVGEENRDTLETGALIGRVLSASGKFEQALEKLRDVSERQKNLFGAKHPTIADTLAFIGECFFDQGMATEARGQFADCYNMRKQFFTGDQIHIAESMVDVIRCRQGQPDRALAIYRNAREVYKDYLTDDHVLIGRLYVYEGDSYAELLNFSKAIERYEHAKQIFHKAFGGECAIDSALVAVNIGKVLLRKCDYDSAKTSFTSALNIYQQILPKGHHKIASTLNHLDRVEQEEALCV
ncbi:hypothetical protein ACHAXR_010070, partial [Thalassiosira sp. AJA248-18]